MSAADLMIREIAPTMGNLAKVNYSHTDMIDFIIANPGISQGALAARYGYTQSWISNVMASDAWQYAMAARREQIVDPTLVATVEQRFRGLTLQSLNRLQEILERPACPANVVLKAVELGAKALGMGGMAPPPPPQPAEDQLAKLANRLLDLQSNARQGAQNGLPKQISPDEGNIFEGEAARP
jgi:hypothetical protein